MELGQRIYNGDQAKMVLENETFIAAFDDYETEIIKSWTESPARDLEGREKLWLMLSTLRKVKAMLLQTLTTGKLATEELKHQRSMIERKREKVSAFSQE